MAGTETVSGQGLRSWRHSPMAASRIRGNREFFPTFLRLIQGAPKACRLLKGLCQIAALALRRSKIWSPSMTWTCPEIIEICVGMEITSYESAEV